MSFPPQEGLDCPRFETLRPKERAHYLFPYEAGDPCEEARRTPTLPPAVNPTRTQILSSARPPTTDQERALYQAMHDESEAHWCASWYSGCEYLFWNRGLFRDLARAAGGWIVWVDDQDLPGLLFGDWGPRVVSLEEWEILRKMGCPGCGGSGAVDTGGIGPWGQPITAPCPFCTEP